MSNFIRNFRSGFKAFKKQFGGQTPSFRKTQNFIGAGFGVPANKTDPTGLGKTVDRGLAPMQNVAQGNFKSAAKSVFSGGGVLGGLTQKFRGMF